MSTGHFILHLYPIASWAAQAPLKTSKEELQSRLHEPTGTICVCQAAIHPHLEALPACARLLVGAPLLALPASMHDTPRILHASHPGQGMLCVYVCARALVCLHTHASCLPGEAHHLFRLRAARTPALCGKPALHCTARALSACITHSTRTACMAAGGGGAARLSKPPRHCHAQCRR